MPMGWGWGAGKPPLATVAPPGYEAPGHQGEAAPPPCHALCCEEPVRIDLETWGTHRTSSLYMYLYLASHHRKVTFKYSKHISGRRALGLEAQGGVTGNLQ